MDDLSVCQYVRASVGRSVCPVHCENTADRIRMPFGILGRTGSGIRQLVGFGDRCTRKGTFGANLGRAIVHRAYRAYVCYSAATRPSCQITLGSLVFSLRCRAVD